MLKHWLVPLLSLVILLAIGLALETQANAYTQLIVLYIFVNIILAISLNLVNGFTGQFSIGHAGFMAIGAYVSAYLSMQDWQLSTVAQFFSFPLFAILGGLMAAAAGFIVGMPSLRLRGDYLAIVTLGFGEIIRVILLNMQVVGGARGLFGIPSPPQLDLGFLTTSPFFSNYIWAAFWVVVTLVFHWRLIRSSNGRCLMSVREDEIAAEAMGVNTTYMKVQAFIISSFFAGVAGALFAHATRYLNPSTFSFTKSVDVIIMVVLGGMGSLTGSVVAAAIVTVLPEWVLRPLQEYTKVDLRMVIYSLALIIFMVIRPQGIFGRWEWTELWNRLRKQKEARL